MEFTLFWILANNAGSVFGFRISLESSYGFIGKLITQKRERKRERKEVREREREKERERERKRERERTRVGVRWSEVEWG